MLFNLIPTDSVLAVAFLSIPLIIWISIRNGPHGATLVSVIAASILYWEITRDQNPLTNGSGLTVYTFICMICTMQITALVISASMAKLTSTQESLSYLSTHDALTGLFNRLFFETEFKRLENSRKYPISIIMADVDNLKAINDNFGHKTGDQILINTAKLFAHVFRSEDIVSRFGGDEFTIILPDTKDEIAKKVVTRIKEQIASYNGEHSDLPINISMGVSTANQGESLKGHLKLADERMYAEKQRKRSELTKNPIL